MDIPATEVKKLRDATGAGFMDAKKALIEADGDFTKAAELLRITGAAKAAKRSDREAANGIVAAFGHSLIQLGAETDFVAKNQEFVDLAQAVVTAVDAAGAETVESALAVPLASGQTVAEAIAALSGKIGEKMELVQVAHFGGAAHVYLHRRSQDLPPQVGVLVEYEGADEQVVHQVALQIASMSPIYVQPDDVPDQVVADERRIAEAKAREDGAPEQAIGRIVEGRLKAFLRDVCLHDQAAVAEDGATVGQILARSGVTVKRFVRFSAGG
ncbi:MAG: translation elongation factor Ts [Propionibacteriaceae bacterium]|jgi:elongation factor Ts|nr:translation elongation factor Ts [Propionibacteriaceae bacterium]